MSAIRSGRNSSLQSDEVRGEHSKGMRPMARSGRSGNTTGSRQSSQAAAQQRHTIIIEDDDDDIQDSSPRSFAQARSSGRSTRQRNTSVVDSTEDPLELRLGPTGFSSPAYLRRRINVASRAQLPAELPHFDARRPARAVPLTIDLTSPTPSNDDCILITEKLAPQVSKRKRIPTVTAGANEQARQEPVKELRLTCPICMDVMKEETSTVCGHLFCKGCIHGAIATQKKCPTCRHKLTNKCTHRIYLSASLRNS